MNLKTARRIVIALETEGETQVEAGAYLMTGRALNRELGTDRYTDRGVYYWGQDIMELDNGLDDRELELEIADYVEACGWRMA